MQRGSRLVTYHLPVLDHPRMSYWNIAGVFDGLLEGYRRSVRSAGTSRLHQYESLDYRSGAQLLWTPRRIEVDIVHSRTSWLLRFPKELRQLKGWIGRMPNVHPYHYRAIPETIDELFEQRRDIIREEAQRLQARPQAGSLRRSPRPSGTPLLRRA